MGANRLGWKANPLALDDLDSNFEEISIYEEVEEEEVTRTFVSMVG